MSYNSGENIQSLKWDPVKKKRLGSLSYVAVMFTWCVLVTIVAIVFALHLSGFAGLWFCLWFGVRG